MNGLHDEIPNSLPGESRATFTPQPGARAAIVNRTRRVVREQALSMSRQRQRTRGLWLPILLCSVLLLITCYGAWALLETSELTYNGVLDGSYQTLIFLAWSLPVTILVSGLIWKQHSRVRYNGDL